VVVHGQVYVIEVNPRSSRTIPFLSKVTNVPMVNIATRAALGETLKAMGYAGGLLPDQEYTAVKAPVFSFAKMQQVDISLGPEMKSTGEVMGVDFNYARALYKAITAAGMNIPMAGAVLFTVADKDKAEAGELAKSFVELGYRLIATEGTARYLQGMGLEVYTVFKVRESGINIIDMIKAGKINMVINTLTQGKEPERDGFRIRRATVEHAIPCLTSIDTAHEVLRVMEVMRERRLVYALALQDYVGGGDALV
jgi:carbamoyl-phosphate synthase large subunit